SNAPNCAGAGCGGECLPIMGPLEAKPEILTCVDTDGEQQTENMRLDCQIPGRHRPAMLHALQLARQVPCLFSVGGTSVSISRAIALRHYPALPRSSRTATIWPIGADLVNIRQTSPLIFRRALP